MSGDKISLTEMSDMRSAAQMVQRELKSQAQQWGLEHDIECHGSVGLAEAARIIASTNEPDTSGYDGNEWFFALWYKHKRDPARRYAIAAALLQNAIKCSFYEAGAKTELMI